MRCPWCHNPEGIKAISELVWYEQRCIGAGHCVKNCPSKALMLTKAGINIDRSRCDACGKCVDACPASALEVLGKRYTVAEITSLALRDRIFYEKSGGGVTISGGEPSRQTTFAATLMQAIHHEGVKVALDTCAASNWNSLHPLVELADLILLDLKLMNGPAHLKITGIPLELVISNSLEMAKLRKPIWIRTPVIPGYTDNPDNIKAVARFIKEHLPTVERYDLLTFNKFCAAKYRRLGFTWDLEKVEQVCEEDMQNLADVAKAEGLDCVHWAGMTRVK